MSYPVVVPRVINEVLVMNCAMAFSGGQFFSCSASYSSVMKPPAEIVTFLHPCVSNVQTLGPRERCVLLGRPNETQTS